MSLLKGIVDGSRMKGSSSLSEHEIFSKIQVPPDTPFFVRLDGRRFRRIAERVNAEKPFDERFAQCLTAAAKAMFQSNLSPALVYVASDEINPLFLHTAPFQRRVEKIDSVLAGIASSAFSLSLLELFEQKLVVAFDSRVVPSSSEKVSEYLTWRQKDAWRNHNNAYAYWLLRRMGHRSSEAAGMLKGLKTEGLHELLFRHGVNLAQTPVWQRRGILVYREPYQKPVEKGTVTRRRIGEDWNLPLFSSTEGKALIQRILEWAKPGKEAER